MLPEETTVEYGAGNLMTLILVIILINLVLLDVFYLWFGIRQEVINQLLLQTCKWLLKDQDISDKN